AKDTLCIGALLHRRQIFDWKHHALVLISYVKNLRNRRSLLLPLRGFTLAEVLITLGIIGVVAALTIPTLMQSYQNKQYVSGFQRAWGLLSNVVEMSEAENGFSTTWDDTSEIDTTTGDGDYYLEKYWLPYFKISKNCGHSLNQGCLAKSVSYLNGAKGGWHKDNNPQYKILLNNGMGINFALGVNSENREHIVVDINGPEKGPNTYGRDIWFFEFYPYEKKKIYPYGAHGVDQSKILSNCSTTSPDVYPGQYCGAYLLKNGYKMDY
ncbi:type II secretion system protein, partial [bacterium]|nr:type II secretion system protein [bacterium]